MLYLTLYLTILGLIVFFLRLILERKRESKLGKGLRGGGERESQGYTLLNTEADHDPDLSLNQ